MEKLEFKGLDECLYTETLSNGLKVFIFPNKRVKNFYITFTCRYGSIDTEFKCDGSKEFKKVHNGVAHFLEHVNFNVSEGVTAHDIFNKYGSSINAFTTYDMTSYEVTGSSLFKENLCSLLDYVQTPYFTKELIEKEKGIICEEVRMGRNSVGRKLFNARNNAIYNVDKRKYLVTGTEEDVNNTTVEELQSVYDTFYHPANMFVIVSGNVDPEETLKIIKENQDSKTFPKYKNPVVKRDKEPVPVNIKNSTIEGNIEIPKTYIVYKMDIKNFKGISVRNINTYLNTILVANFRGSSYLYDELMRSNLITSLFIGCDVIEDMVYIELNVESKKMDEVLPILLDKMNHLEMDSEILKRRRRCMISSIIGNSTDIEYVNSNIMCDLITYKDIEFNVMDRINSLNMDDIKKVIDGIDTSNYSIIKMVAYKDK